MKDTHQTFLYSIIKRWHPSPKCSGPFKILIKQTYALKASIPCSRGTPETAIVEKIPEHYHIPSLERITDNPKNSHMYINFLR